MKRKRGAQPGNQNARKHGFYSKALGEAQRHEFRQAADVEGLDEEITLLRVEIKSLMEQDPPNRRLIAQDVKILAALVSARHKMRADNKDDWVEKVRDLLEKNGHLFPRLRNSPENSPPEQNK